MWFWDLEGWKSALEQSLWLGKGNKLTDGQKLYLQKGTLIYFLGKERKKVFKIQKKKDLGKAEGSQQQIPDSRKAHDFWMISHFMIESL